jgi:O-antigen/teichoic acid export membrane protein
VSAGPVIGAERETGAGAAGATYDSVAGSVTRGGLWSIGGQVITFGAALIATPFTLRLLGPARYGLWSILQTTLSWVGLADLGMADASTRFGGDRLARGDTAGEVSTVWTAAAITISVTTCVAACVALAARFMLSNLLHVRGALLGPGSLALRVICVACVAQAVSGTLNTPQFIRLRWRSYTVVTVGSSVLQILTVPVALVAVAGGVVTAASVALAAAVVGAVGTVWVAARVQPALFPPKLSLRIAKTVLRYGAPLTVSGIASIPLATAERFLLAHYTSTVVVAYYAVASRLGMLLWVLPAAIAQPLFPALVALAGAGRTESARALYRQALQGSFLILTPAIFMLAFLARPFLALWAGPAYARHSTGPFYVVLVGVWFNALSTIPFSYLLASNRTGFMARVRLLELGPYVAIAAVLTSTVGAIGAAIVWSARTIVESIVFFFSAARTGKMAFSPLSSRAFASAAMPASLAVALTLLALVTSGLVARVAYLAPLAAIYCATTWFVVLTPRERARLLILTKRRAKREEG